MILSRFFLVLFQDTTKIICKSTLPCLCLCWPHPLSLSLSSFLMLCRILTSFFQIFRAIFLSGINLICLLFLISYSCIGHPFSPKSATGNHHVLYTISTYWYFSMYYWLPYSHIKIYTDSYKRRGRKTHHTVCSSFHASDCMEGLRQF